jgi:hypothetical protein
MLLNNGVIFMEKNYLVHFGIKGQKWGVRNFQNQDGTYTEEGKARRRAMYDEAFKPGKDGKASRAEKVARSASDIMDNSQRVSRKLSDWSGKKERARYEKISKMSDQELRDKINRANLEKQYSDIMRQEETRNTGKHSIDDYLDVALPVSAIATSAVTIFASLYAIWKSGANNG